MQVLKRMWQVPLSYMGRASEKKDTHMVLYILWKWKLLHCVWHSLQLYSPWNSPGQNTGVGSLSFLQGIFPTQGLNSGLQDCRQILYLLSHKGSPRILEWVAYPFPRGSSWPRNWTQVSCIVGGFYQLSYQGSPIYTVPWPQVMA